MAGPAARHEALPQNIEWHNDVTKTTRFVALCVCVFFWGGRRKVGAMRLFHPWAGERSDARLGGARRRSEGCGLRYWGHAWRLLAHPQLVNNTTSCIRADNALMSRGCRTMSRRLVEGHRSVAQRGWTYAMGARLQRGELAGRRPRAQLPPPDATVRMCGLRCSSPDAHRRGAPHGAPLQRWQRCCVRPRRLRPVHPARGALCPSRCWGVAYGAAPWRRQRCGLRPRRLRPMRCARGPSRCGRGDDLAVRWSVVT